jgi:outer membrane receptor for ferrienterochelin and colicin
MLKPELAWSLEASYEHNDTKELTYSAKFIVRRISDLHRMETKFVNDFWWRQVVNAGNGISKRVDLNTQFPLKRFWVESPDINLSFNISKNWSSVSYLPKPDNKLTSTPMNASLSLDYNSTNLPLSLGGNWRYRQSQPYLLAENQRSSSPSSIELDMYGLWKFTPKSKLRLAIDNVLNRRLHNLMQWFNPESEVSQYSSNRYYRQLKLSFDHSF